MQAIRYHRYSSKKQDKGSSLERQSEKTQALCEAKKWTVVETVQDLGQSAWKGDHLSVGELGKLRKRIDSGLIPSPTTIVVENLDRLSRQDYRTARRWIEDVTDRGIIIAVCSPELTLDAAAMSGANIGPMIQHLLESNRASAESNRKSEFQIKNIARMLDMVRAGICPSPRVPGWLIGVVGQPVTINEDRAALVHRIYEWSASGLGLQSICQKLNADHQPWTTGWKTKSSQWKVGYVRDILRSPAVEGKYVVHGPDKKETGEIITNYYPRVVDAGLVNRARAAIDRRAGTGGPQRGDAVNLFIGLVICKTCGGAVGRVVGGKGYAYLLCRNSRYGLCQNRAGMPYATLSKIVVDHLLHLALDDAHFSANDDIAPLLARVAAGKSRVETLWTEQANLLRILRQLPGSAALVRELAKIEVEIATAETSLTADQDALIAARGTVSPTEHLRRVHLVRDALDTDPEARRMVRDALPALINQMTWDGEKVNVAGTHFFLTVERDGSISGYDLFHPRVGAANYPDYARTRDAARENETFLPIVGG